MATKPSDLITVTTVVQSAGIYAQHLPSTFQLRKETATPELYEDVHAGLWTAHALSLGISGIASLLTRNLTPLLTALAAAVIIHVVYTVAMLSPGHDERKQAKDDRKAAALPGPG